MSSIAKETFGSHTTLILLIILALKFLLHHIFTAQVTILFLNACPGCQVFANCAVMQILIAHIFIHFNTRIAKYVDMNAYAICVS